MPKKGRWVWLLISSYLFCIYANLESAIALLLVTIISFACGFLIGKTEERKSKRVYLISGIFLVLLPLFVAKYLNFSLRVTEDILRGLNLSKDFIIIKFIVPLGISFYTLQAISYLMDIYNNVIQPERNFGQYALYLAFFPKLISGPVERGGFLLPQIEKLKPFDYQRLIDGSTRIIWGFFKNLLLLTAWGSL